MYREVPVFYFNEPFFWCFLIFKKYLNPQVTAKKLVKSIFYPPLSFRISLSDTSLGFYLSTMLVESSLTCICQYVWERFFNLLWSDSQNINKSILFYSCPSLPLKSPDRIFWKSVSSKTKWVGWRKLWFALSIFNQKIWKWLGTLVFSHLVWLQFF